MKRLALIAVLFLSSCAITPSCFVMVSIPHFIPSFGCGLDFGRKEAAQPETEEEDMEDEDV